jgi:hypothetical protein
LAALGCQQRKVDVRHREAGRPAKHTWRLGAVGDDLSGVLFGLICLVQPGEAHGGIEGQLGGVEGEVVLGICWRRQPGEPKTARGRRTIALDPATVAALRQYRKRQAEERLRAGPHYADSGLAFTMPDGAPIHPNRFSLWFRRRARAAGLPAIRLHDMRHSYATAGLAAGVPPKVMSERLGHATVAFTLDTYTSALPAMDKSAADVVAALILGTEEVRGSSPGP